MTVIVRKVSSPAEVKAFIQFPNTLYKGDPYFVPALAIDEKATFDRKRNGAYEFCDSELFMAYRDGRPVGRVAAIINRKANETWGVRQVRFGWIDFTEDFEVAEALVDAVRSWGRERGMDSIAGPLGFTDFDPEGMLVEGFDRLGTMITIYNRPYYPEYLERMGFVKDADWVEYRITLPDRLPERFSTMSRIIAEKYGVHLRKLTRKEMRKGDYGQKLFRLINETYSELYGYSLLSNRQIDQYVNQYLDFIDPRMISFVEDSGGNLVAAGITIPSLSEALQKSSGKLLPFGWFHLLKALMFRRPDTLDLLLVAVRPEYQGKGLNSIIFSDLIPHLLKMGFKYAESNPELETNTKVRTLWSVFDNEIHKRRRVYTRAIDQ